MKNHKQKITGLLLVVLSGLFFGCNNDVDPFDFQAQLVKETQQIDDFLSANGITAVKDPSGVRIVITKMGTGLPALSFATLNVDYVGKLFSDGTIFDQGTAPLPLPKYIPGWRIAFAQLPVGSEATLYIPSYYGYADEKKEKIPAHSTLVFDVTFNKAAYSTTYFDQLKTDTTSIVNYLESKGIEALRDTAGVYYVITNPGIGAKPGFYDKLNLSFSIKLLTNDTKTLISLDREPNEFFYSRPVDYIQGMLISLLKMQEGTKATLYIPSGLAFGVNGGYDNNNTLIVPPNNNIIVEVDFTSID
jgi:FKBP-type peptidyl-prolyl cis-trans isomerase